MQHEKNQLTHTSLVHRFFYGELDPAYDATGCCPVAAAW